MTKSKMANRYSPEVRARAVRMVFEHQGSYETQAGAIAAIAPKIGCIPQTLREWVKQAEKDSGMRDGVTTEERDRIKALEREVRELRQANEILRKASAYFAQAELDRLKPRYANQGPSLTPLEPPTLNRAPRSGEMGQSASDLRDGKSRLGPWTQTKLPNEFIEDPSNKGVSDAKGG